MKSVDKRELKNGRKRRVRLGDLDQAFANSLSTISGTAQHDKASATNVVAGGLELFCDVFKAELDFILLAKQSGRNGDAEV